VGDAVMSLPAITSTRLSFPQADIAILTKPWVAEIFHNSPMVDRVILYQSPGIHQGIQGKWRLAQKLKEEGFELALLLQNAFEAALISCLARIPRRAGYNTDGRSLLLTHPVACNQKIKKGHQVDYYLEMVESLGFLSVRRTPYLEVSQEQQEEALRMLKSLGVRETEEIVGISPGATYGSAKQWFPERYGKLVEQIGKDLGARILIFGSHGDKKVALQVRQNARIPLMDLTGIMHVAAALGVPLIALFGSTDPQRTGPRGELCRVIGKPIPCAPCMKTECLEDRQCMGLISVDEVYEEVKKIWELGN
jgi:heptosyltransferase-2